MVTYDLKQPIGSYTGLFGVLKSKDSWWHYLSTTWLVATEDTPSALQDELVKHIFKGDRVLIVAFRSEYSGWLPKKAWEWIATHK